jgi:hypothetical protein
VRCKYPRTRELTRPPCRWRQADKSHLWNLTVKQVQPSQRQIGQAATGRRSRRARVFGVVHGTQRIQLLLQRAVRPPSQRRATRSPARSWRKPLTETNNQTPAEEPHAARCAPEAAAPDSLPARGAHHFGRAAPPGGARHRCRAARPAAGRLCGLLRGARLWLVGRGRGRRGRRRDDARAGCALRAGQRLIGDWDLALFLEFLRTCSCMLLQSAINGAGPLLIS